MLQTIFSIKSLQTAKCPSLQSYKSSVNELIELAAIKHQLDIDLTIIVKFFQIRKGKKI